ncbi:efflux transporter outer membrane subunit [Pelomonas sp. SE-A7]|uniref:efflux transporter outer membrane subunit n=1 Tax=Pelomonas sp. SE-A7 TaxID=3054953 RepID=UPI00259CF962|nr:efflux transporter outer membrane subunit [Pelomonas sp. SE-A7]MDM4767618.1 efflux transporter outer membrane subunit [Pelomonas sp. SE-A7]
MTWFIKNAGLAVTTLALAACATVQPSQPPQQPPAAWQASLPAGPGASADWWARFDDPLLAQLIAEAQAANPGLQQALARLAQARALAGISASSPQVGASLSSQRSKPVPPPGQPLQTLNLAGVDARWEIDLFARARQQDAAAQARAEAGGFDAAAVRISLAAEVAQTYLGLRACEQQQRLAELDAQSGDRLAKLSSERFKVGFEAAGSHALFQAAAAEGQSRSLAQQAECQVLVKQLVALGLGEESALRGRLEPRRARLPEPQRFALNAVPAQTLAQRPDLASAAAQLRAAWAEAGAAQAARYPQLQLAGSISRAELKVGGSSGEGNGWSLGPVLTLPLLDGGARKAQAEAARAAFDAAQAGYRATVLNAVREVEESLVRLEASQARESHAKRSAENYAASLTATEQRWRGGLAGAAELEEARRLALAAQAAELQVQRERIGAWIALYKAAGGGWSSSAEAAR